MSRVALDLAGDQVAGHDADRSAVLRDEFEHLGSGEELHVPETDLSGERLVGREQELLAGLPSCVERPGHLGSTEGAVVEQPAVLPCVRCTLGDRLVDDRVGHLGESVDVRLARAIVAALDRVVEQAEHAVVVVRVVLRCVDSALSSDRVGASGRIVVGEGLDVVSKLTERRCRPGAGEAGSHDDEVVLAAVGRVDELHVELALRPLVLDRPFWDLGVEDGGVGFCSHGDPLPQPDTVRMPSWTAIGIDEFPIRMARASATASHLRQTS